MKYFVNIYLPTAHSRYLGPFDKKKAEQVCKKFDGLVDIDGIKIIYATIESFDKIKNVEKELVEEFFAVMVK